MEGGRRETITLTLAALEEEALLTMVQLVNPVQRLPQHRVTPEEVRQEMAVVVAVVQAQVVVRRVLEVMVCPRRLPERR